METIASAAILTAATLLAFAFALLLHWAFLSLLFRSLPGAARVRPSARCIAGKVTAPARAAGPVYARFPVHPASPSQIVR